MSQDTDYRIVFPAVEDFDKMSDEEATKYVYESLVPRMEERKVLLSDHGNHTGTSKAVTREEYFRLKTEKKLFDIARVKTAFPHVKTEYEKVEKDGRNSYGLKHTVERKQGEYIANGDSMLAFILAGYEVRFFLFENLQQNGEVMVQEK